MIITQLSGLDRMFGPVASPEKMTFPTAPSGNGANGVSVTVYAVAQNSPITLLTGLPICAFRTPRQCVSILVFYAWSVLHREIKLR